MRRLLERLLGSRSSSSPPAHCGACAAKDAEIAWLREQHDRTLDRLLATAGVLQATREAIEAERAASEIPPPEPIDGGGEDDPEHIPASQQERDAEAQKQWADENDRPITATYDA